VKTFAYVIIGSSLLCATGVGLLLGLNYARTQSPPPGVVAPPSTPYRELTETTSTGGHETLKDSASATGSRFDGRGDNVKASDVRVESGHASLQPGGGKAEGGGLEGNFSAKVDPKTLTIIALLGAVGFGIAGYVKYRAHPTDLHHWAGCGLASVGCLLVAINNDLLWYGLGGVGVYLAVHLLPTFTSTGVEHKDGALASIQKAVKTFDPVLQSNFWAAVDKVTTPEQDVEIAKAAKKGGV